MEEVSLFPFYVQSFPERSMMAEQVDLTSGNL